MEERFEIATSLGEVWMWGRDTGKPIVLVITGAFAEAHVYDQMQSALPQFDVLRAHLPGNHSPPLLATSIGVMAGALSEALALRFANRRLVVIGVSTGALVAMAMRAAATALLLIEPFLRTRHIWLFPPMVEAFPEPQQRDFLWNVLGVREGEVAERDYRHLAAGLKVPGLVLLGTEPLQPQRDLEMMPSLVDAADRATLRAQPLLRLTEVPGAGHNVAAQDFPVFRALLERLVRTIVPDAVVL